MGEVLGMDLYTLVILILVINNCLNCILLDCSQVKSGRGVAPMVDKDSRGVGVNRDCATIVRGLNFNTCASSFAFFVSNKGRS